MKRLFICMAFFIAGASAQAASFDCAKAATTIEKLICSHDKLSDLDSKLMQVYRQALNDPVSADSIKSDQKTWLAGVRNKCADVECLERVYTERIDVLKSLVPPNLTEQTEVSKALPTQSGETKKTDGANGTTPSQAPKTPPEQSGASTAQTASTAVTSVEKAQAEKTVSKEAEVMRPDAGIAGFFNGIYSLLAGVLLIGLINPKWILRWDANASRKKLVGYFFAIALPFGLLGELTKSDATKKYEAKIRAFKEAEREKNADLAKQSRESDISRAEMKNEICSVSGLAAATALERLEAGGEVDPRKMADEIPSLTRVSVSPTHLAKAKAIWANAIETVITQREKYRQQYNEQGAPNFSMAMSAACRNQYVKPDPKADEEEMQAWRSDMEKRDAEAARQAANRPKPMWQRMHERMNGGSEVCQAFKTQLEMLANNGVPEQKINETATHMYDQVVQLGCIR